MQRPQGANKLFSSKDQKKDWYSLSGVNNKTVGRMVTEVAQADPAGLCRPCRSSDTALSVMRSYLRVLSRGVM